MLQPLLNCSVSPSSSFLLTSIKKTTRNELARLGMGTIFLVIYIWPMSDSTYVSNMHAHVRMRQLLKIVYALDIKFGVRWCTCSMWRMLLPYYLLFLISIILFLKTDIRILYTFKDLARSPCNGNYFSSYYV